MCRKVAALTSALKVASAIALAGAIGPVLDLPGASPPITARMLEPRPSSMDFDTVHVVITDLIIEVGSQPRPAPAGASDGREWHRIEKDLLLHQARQSSWLHVAVARAEELIGNDLVVTDIAVGDLHHAESSGSGQREGQWESRSAGVWIRRRLYTGDIHAVTGLDVLFGTDSVDPRQYWNLIREPLRLNAAPNIPIARLTVRHGQTKSLPNGPGTSLKTNEHGKFRILQISDTHMVTGVGVCGDSIGPDGDYLPVSEADPRTVDFIGGIMDIEKPDLVLLTGDQLHHDILDSQSALFKVYAPVIGRSIPYAAVFGNHDDEGKYALSRSAQMDILRRLPHSLCQSGAEDADGVGNYYLQVLHKEKHVATLYLLDSHSQKSSNGENPDYDYINQSQIDWFTNTSQELRRRREEDDTRHVSLAFMHIPFPEYAGDDLILEAGQRREPTEGPSFNSHFYDALADEKVAVAGCGHDHVNDFCALLPGKGLQGPWLCYGGGSGFGGYCSYGGKRYYRRTRVWELDANTLGLRTWKRIEYAKERVDELVLVERGKVVAPSHGEVQVTGDIDAQSEL